MQKIYTLIFLIISFSLSAQVGVGTRNPDASAMFQVESNNKGILIPKVALTSASDIATAISPANGLLVFNTSTTSSSNDSLSPGFYFYNGSEWKRLLNSGDELVTTYSAGEGIELDGTSFSVSSNVVTSTYTGDIDVTGDITATAFVGDGSGLTGISVDDASISTSKLVDGSVTSSKLSDNTITESKLADESVTNSKVASDAAIDFTKLDITKSDITGLGVPTEDTDTTYSAGEGIELDGTSFSVSSNVVTSTYTGDIDVTGDITANAFIGDGSGLTNVFKGSGDYSTAMGYNTKASGNYSTAMGESTKASGNYSTAMGWSTKALGNYSTAMGSGTEAIGDYSIAMGFVTNASGYISTAMGYNTEASGIYSTAMGRSTKASGEYSTAMGSGTEASGDYSTAMAHDTEASGDYSTAMGHNTEASGDYSTAMGKYTKASGLHSTAVGNRTNAKAVNSFAAGSRSLAESYTEFVIGRYNKTTSGVSSITWITTDPLFTVGNGSSLSNRNNAFQILKNGDATFYSNLSLKKNLDVEGDIDVTGTITATAFVGDGSGLTNVFKGSGDYSTSMGYETKASGDYSTATGNETEASGKNSFAAGAKSLAESHSEFVIGRFNKTTPDAYPNAWVNGDPLFTVGNGQDNENRSNAFQILKGGNATFYKNLEVKGTLTESSDIRLKKNIVNILNATETINKLSPKRYNKKTKLTSEEYSIEEMGFIAQDIEKILPFLVTKDNSADEILSLDYTSFIALLTQGFKEQSAKIEMQTNKLEQLEAQTTKLNQLEERLKGIEKLLNENQP